MDRRYINIFYFILFFFSCYRNAESYEPWLKAGLYLKLSEVLRGLKKGFFPSLNFYHCPQSRFTYKCHSFISEL